METQTSTEVTLPETTQNVEEFPSMFEKNRYLFVEEGVNKDVAKLLAQYAIFSSFQNFAPEPDYEMVPGAHGRYADPLMESLLIQLKPFIENVTGLRLWPTYSYYRLYTPGDVLAPHKDRPSCEVSLTVNLGYKYLHHESNYSWNIWVDGKEFVTKPGDMVIYRGNELDHWRNPFEGEKGSWQAQAFLHYVNADGPYSFMRYDGRPNIGYPPASKDMSIGDFASKVQEQNRQLEESFIETLFFSNDSEN